MCRRDTRPNPSSRVGLQGREANRRRTGQFLKKSFFPPRQPLFCEQRSSDQQAGVFPMSMGTDLQGPADHGGGRGPAGASQSDPGAEHSQLPDGKRTHSARRGVSAGYLKPPEPKTERKAQERSISRSGPLVCQRPEVADSGLWRPWRIRGQGKPRQRGKVASAGREGPVGTGSRQRRLGARRIAGAVCCQTSWDEPLRADL